MHLVLLGGEHTIEKPTKKFHLHIEYQFGKFYLIRRWKEYCLDGIYFSTCKTEQSSWVFTLLQPKYSNYLHPTRIICWQIQHYDEQILPPVIDSN